MSKKKTPPLYGDPVIFRCFWNCFWEREREKERWIFKLFKAAKKNEKEVVCARAYLADPWLCSPTRTSYRLSVQRCSSSVVPNWFLRAPFGCAWPPNSFQTCSSSLSFFLSFFLLFLFLLVILFLFAFVRAYFVYLCLITRTNFRPRLFSRSKLSLLCSQNRL